MHHIRQVERHKLEDFMIVCSTSKSMFATGEEISAQRYANNYINYMVLKFQQKMQHVGFNFYRPHLHYFRQDVRGYYCLFVG